MELVAVGVHRWDGGGVAAPVARTGAVDGQGFPGLWWELEEMTAPACTGGSFCSSPCPAARCCGGHTHPGKPGGADALPACRGFVLPAAARPAPPGRCAGAGVAGRLRCPVSLTG